MYIYGDITNAYFAMFLAGKRLKIWILMLWNYLLFVLMLLFVHVRSVQELLKFVLLLSVIMLMVSEWTSMQLLVLLVVL